MINRELLLTSLPVILAIILFPQASLASISVSTNGDTGDQNISVPSDSGSSNGVTVTVNGEGNDQVVNIPSQNQTTLSNDHITITNNVSSNDSPQNNSTQPSNNPPPATPTSMPAKENHSVSNQVKISSPTLKPLVSLTPTLIKPSIAITIQPKKYSRPLKTISKIWTNLINSISGFLRPSFLGQKN